MVPAIRAKGRVHRVRIMLKLLSRSELFPPLTLPDDHERLFISALHTISLLSLPDTAYQASPLEPAKWQEPFRGAWRADKFFPREENLLAELGQYRSTVPVGP